MINEIKKYNKKNTISLILFNIIKLCNKEYIIIGQLYEYVENKTKIHSYYFSIGIQNRIIMEHNCIHSM